MNGDELKQHILEKLRDLDKKMDSHISDNTHQHRDISKEVTSMQLDLVKHKTKVTTTASVISAGISAFVASFMAWLGMHR